MKKVLLAISAILFLAIGAAVSFGGPVITTNGGGGGGGADLTSPGNIGTTTPAGNIDAVNITVSGAANFIGASVSGITGTGSLWTAVANIVATPASVSTITTNADLTGVLGVMTPLKIVIGGNTQYDVVSAITSNTITVKGAPLSGNIDSLSWGKSFQCRSFVYNIPGAVTASNQEIADSHSVLAWGIPDAYIVGLDAYLYAAGANTVLNLLVNGNSICAGGITVNADKTIFSCANIDTGYYHVAAGSNIEIAAAGAGANSITMSVKYVTP
jgi:hypothetical protein